MPTTRSRRFRKSTAVEPWQIEFLLHGCVKRPDGTNSPRPYIWRKGEPAGPFYRNWRPLWDELRDELLKTWAKDHPDSLPWAARQELEGSN